MDSAQINWFMEQTWDQVFQAETANEKANIFQQLLLKALEDFLPEKIRKVCSEDQVWITHKLEQLGPILRFKTLRLLLSTHFKVLKKSEKSPSEGPILSHLLFLFEN